MKRSSTGQYYVNFPDRRFFINEGENCITLRCYQTYLGKTTNPRGWLCLSWRSGKPILYCFTFGYGIRNITYEAEFDLTFKEFLRTVPYRSAKSYQKSSRKKNR